MWPTQGLLIFGAMSALPPLIAIARGKFAAFVASLPISILAYVLARYTALVPIAIVLLITSFFLSVRQPNSENRRLERSLRLALLSFFFVVIGIWGLRLATLYNWRPPKLLEKAFASPPMSDMDLAITRELNVQFPKGVDEAVLKSLLLKQGFKDVADPRPTCRTAETRWREYRSCPKGAREMTYSFEALGFICGSRRVSVNWSIDADGKITRLEGIDQTRCS